MASEMDNSDSPYRDLKEVLVVDSSASSSAPRTTKTNRPGVKFDEEDWERIHLLSDYEPFVNGRLNPDYVELKAKMQLQRDIEVNMVGSDGKLQTLKDSEVKFVSLGEDVVKGRVERTLEYDKLVHHETIKAATNCLENDICKNILIKNGEEVLATLKCVAFLNAPQTLSDHMGQGEIFLTKRVTEAGVNRYRLFYYSYGITARTEAEEKSISRDSSWIELFENFVLFAHKSSHGQVNSHQHHAGRTLSSAFISLPIDDVLTSYHRVSDILDIKAFISNDNLKERHFKFGECTECDVKNCCVHFNIWFCNICHFFDLHVWRWKISESQGLQLNDLICKVENRIEKNSDVLSYDHVRDESTPMRSTVVTTTSSRRFHTLNLTFLDSIHTDRKFQGVVVLDPYHESNERVIDFVCKLNKIVEDLVYTKINQPLPVANSTSLFGDVYSGLPRELVYAQWLGAKKLDSRNPFQENMDIQGILKEFWKEMFSSTGFAIHVEVSNVYYYNLVFLILVSFIGMIVGYVEGGAISIIVGLFSTCHFLNRVYNIPFKVYQTSTFYKDGFFAVLGFFLAIFSFAAGGSSAGAGILSFIQSGSAGFGGVHQYYRKLVSQGVPPSRVVKDLTAEAKAMFDV